MMKKGIAKFTAFCLAAGLTFSGTGIVSLATGADMSLVGIGSTAKVKKTAETEATVSETQEEENVSEAAAEQVQETEETAAETEVETEAPLDTSMVNTTGFAKCNEYVNIRATGDTEGEVLGKLYNNAAVYILGVDEHGWYRVRSGNVEGYVASQYIATGVAAEQLSDEVGYDVAEVGAEVLNVRAAASTDSDVVAVVSESDQIEVVEDCGEWLKVAVDSDTYGYVSVDYVNAETQYKVAESIEEEQARLAEEQAAADAAWLAYLAEQEAAQAQAEAEWLAYMEQQNAAQESVSQGSVSSGSQSTSGSQADADALYQEYLNAQAAADAATQQADEQLVYDTAAAAQEAYRKYLEAQNAADQAAVQQPSAGTSDTYTDSSYTDDTYTDDSYTDDSYTDDTYEDEYVEYEDTSSDDTYEEEYVEDASSASTSSLGQEIANYACQFVGNPYVWGGTSLTNGADCSGFTQSVMANFGIGISRTAASQSGGGSAVDLGSIQPGDLLFYSDGSGIGHVSIYIGNGQVVHASNPSNGIMISSYSYRTPCSARRYW